MGEHQELPARSEEGPVLELDGPVGLDPEARAGAAPVVPQEVLSLPARENGQTSWAFYRLTHFRFKLTTGRNAKRQRSARSPLPIQFLRSHRVVLGPPDHRGRRPFEDRLQRVQLLVVVYGGDARLRLLDQDYLVLNWAQSFDDAEAAGTDSGDVGVCERMLVTARWERRDVFGPMYDVDLSRVGDALEPGLGFLRQSGHTRGNLRLGYGRAPGDLLRTTVRLEGGGFIDGRRTSVQLSPSWTPSRHLGLSASYRLDRIEFADRQQRLMAHVGRPRAEVMLSTEISAVAFVQYKSTLDLAVANVRLRYNPREGDDLYVVWNEGVIANRFDYDRCGREATSAPSS